MSDQKYIVGLYDHEDSLMNAVDTFKDNDMNIDEVLTPFPVHGLEHKLGLKDTSIHTAGFFFGITGTTVALTLMTWIFTSNYPLNIGGKPFFSLLAFIPITFELTVLFASVGMFFVYIFRNKLFPGYIPRIFDKRTTDDRFAIIFDITEDNDQSHASKVKELLKSSGALEIKEKIFEEDEDNNLE